jgi:hypothetical protein
LAFKKAREDFAKAFGDREMKKFEIKCYHEETKCSQVHEFKEGQAKFFEKKSLL